MRGTGKAMTMTPRLCAGAFAVGSVHICEMHPADSSSWCHMDV